MTKDQYFIEVFHQFKAKFDDFNKNKSKHNRAFLKGQALFWVIQVVALIIEFKYTSLFPVALIMQFVSIAGYLEMGMHKHMMSLFSRKNKDKHLISALDDMASHHISFMPHHYLFINYDLSVIVNLLISHKIIDETFLEKKNLHYFKERDIYILLSEDKHEVCFDLTQQLVNFSHFFNDCDYSQKANLMQLINSKSDKLFAEQIKLVKQLLDISYELEVSQRQIRHHIMRYMADYYQIPFDGDVKAYFANHKDVLTDFYQRETYMYKLITPHDKNNEEIEKFNQHYECLNVCQDTSSVKKEDTLIGYLQSEVGNSQLIKHNDVCIKADILDRIISKTNNQEIKEKALYLKQEVAN